MRLCQYSICIFIIHELINKSLITSYFLQETDDVSTHASTTSETTTEMNSSITTPIAPTAEDLLAQLETLMDQLNTTSNDNTTTSAVGDNILGVTSILINLTQYLAVIAENKSQNGSVSQLTSIWSSQAIMAEILNEKMEAFLNSSLSNGTIDDEAAETQVRLALEILAAHRKLAQVQEVLVASLSTSTDPVLIAKAAELRAQLEASKEMLARLEGLVDSSKLSII